MTVDLYFKDGWTQQQISELTGLSIQAISKIINNSTNGNANKSDKRRELKLEDYRVVARLILGGEKQSVIAKKFGVS